MAVVFYFCGEGYVNLIQLFPQRNTTLYPINVYNYYLTNINKSISKIQSVWFDYSTYECYIVMVLPQLSTDFIKATLFLVLGLIL